MSYSYNRLIHDLSLSLYIYISISLYLSIAEQNALLALKLPSDLLSHASAASAVSNTSSIQALKHELATLQPFEQDEYNERQLQQKRIEASNCWVLKTPGSAVNNNNNNNSNNNIKKHHVFHNTHMNLSHRVSPRWLRKTQLFHTPVPVGSVYLAHSLQARLIAHFSRAYTPQQIETCVLYCLSVRAHVDWPTLQYATRLAKKKLLFVDNLGLTFITAFTLPKNAVKT